MRFELFPIIDKMKGLYCKPISANRFQEYITELQGKTKGDMSLPISGFNPMAKEHIIQKLDELIDLEAEKIIERTLEELNVSIANTQVDRTFKVVINLADDLKGGWTNHYTTDFDSKFKLNAFVTRNFCSPYFWSSENYSKELVKQRILEYAFRTIYWTENTKPITLEEHFQQELFVAKKLNTKSGTVDKENYEKLKLFFEVNREKDDYSLIFNFFYGDRVSKSLEFKTFGIGEYTGFHFAKDYK